jgi:hypothetical protein
VNLLSPKVCIFCGGRPLTKEHVLSDWLAPLIRAKMLNYESIEADIGAQGPSSSKRTRSGHPTSRRIRCVCKSCNNGWMKAIVDAAKPTVEQLIQGKPYRLTSRHQKQLAAWIATAVIISEFEDPQQVTIPAADRQWLWTQRTPPSNWKIWIGDYHRSRWVPHWIHHRFSVTGPDEPAPEKGAEGPRNTQTTSYVVGRLYVHAVSSAVSGGALNWQFQGRDRQVLRQIWPASTYSVVWPPPAMEDRDADRIADALMSLALRVVGLPPTKILLPNL